MALAFKTWKGCRIFSYLLRDLRMAITLMRVVKEYEYDVNIYLLLLSSLSISGC